MEGRRRDPHLRKTKDRDLIEDEWADEQAVEKPQLSQFVILSVAKDLVLPRIYEILRSLRSLRMTGEGPFAEVSACYTNQLCSHTGNIVWSGRTQRSVSVKDAPAGMAPTGRCFSYLYERQQGMRRRIPREGGLALKQAGWRRRFW